MSSAGIDEAVPIRQPARILYQYGLILKAYPYTAKSFSTGVTYIFSDLTAQLFEWRLQLQADAHAGGGGGGTERLTLEERLRRTAVFSGVGFFWVGPLLTFVQPNRRPFPDSLPPLAQSFMPPPARPGMPPTPPPLV